ncbi:MAG TPA: phospholipase [Thermoanaerobaculia bacterium]|nr:phospholipase [Thermoanaerobaculia bacterium]
MRHLDLDPERDAWLYVPQSVDPSKPAPFVLLLHPAGGDASRFLERFRAAADVQGVILLSPASRAATWDRVNGPFGPDVAFIDRALRQVFTDYSIDRSRLCIAGFSDGASYALSLGLTNGDLFTHVIAFSPGFMQPASRTGSPRFFVAHGTHDEILLIERTGRPIAAELRRAGYKVEYREHEGGHTVTPELAAEALGEIKNQRAESRNMPRK